MISVSQSVPQKWVINESMNTGTAGMIADVMKNIGADLPNLSKLLSSIKRELRTDEPENQRVALFCLGVVAQQQPGLVQETIQTWLQVPDSILPDRPFSA